MHLHNNIRTQYPDIPVHKQTQYPHTICTQIAHRTHTEQHTYTSTENRTYNTDTEHRTDTPQHRCITYDLHKYSLDYYCLTYISKNSIIQLYTNIIHFGHLIDEVSKITITLIY